MCCLPWKNESPTQAEIYVETQEGNKGKLDVEIVCQTFNFLTIIYLNWCLNSNLLIKFVVHIMFPLTQFLLGLSLLNRINLKLKREWVVSDMYDSFYKTMHYKIMAKYCLVYGLFKNLLNLRQNWVTYKLYSIYSTFEFVAYNILNTVKSCCL